MAPATTHESVLRGILARPLRRLSPTYPPGRVCVAEGCQTWLSIYNKWGLCWLHEPVHRVRAAADQQMKAKPSPQPSPEKKRRGGRKKAKTRKKPKKPRV
jgi:hypothetical protein